MDKAIRFTGDRAAAVVVVVAVAAVAAAAAVAVGAWYEQLIHSSLSPGRGEKKGERERTNNEIPRST